MSGFFLVFVFIPVFPIALVDVTAIRAVYLGCRGCIDGIQDGRHLFRTRPQRSGGC